MLYTDLGTLYVQNSMQHQQCCKNNVITGNLYDVLVKTIQATQQQSMTPHQTSDDRQGSSKEKRAVYMSQLRGTLDSEYRRIVRENNARAMRKKRLENPVYREHERRQNRAHMAQMRRDNPQYRQREHARNRDRMALKRNSLSQTNLSSNTTTEINNINSTSNNNPTDNIINSIYQTLENNLQSSHISFIPYQSSSSLRSFFDYHHQSRRLNNNKSRNECEILQRVDDYCRQQQQHDTGSGSDSNSRTTGSTLSSC